MLFYCGFPVFFGVVSYVFIIEINVVVYVEVIRVHVPLVYHPELIAGFSVATSVFAFVPGNMYDDDVPGIEDDFCCGLGLDERAYAGFFPAMDCCVLGAVDLELINQ